MVISVTAPTHLGKLFYFFFPKDGVSVYLCSFILALVEAGNEC